MTVLYLINNKELVVSLYDIKARIPSFSFKPRKILNNSTENLCVVLANTKKKSQQQIFQEIETLFETLKYYNL